MFPFVKLDQSGSKKLAKYENDIEFLNTFSNLFNLALDRFHFKGLPDTCNERFFKMSLIISGQGLLADDENRGFLTLYSAPSGNEWNIYGESSSVYGYGWNGFNARYTNYMYGSDNTDAKALICRDNLLCYPLMWYIVSAASRMTSTMRTIDTTARKLKTPYYIVCDESQKSTVKKILNDIDYNEDSIITNKSTTPDMFKVLSTNVREGALQALWSHYANLGVNARSVLGIRSAVNQDKKERLLVDEVNADQQLAGLNMAYRMNCYKLFCETANKHFGLDLSVEFEEGEDYVFLSDVYRGATGEDAAEDV